VAAQAARLSGMLAPADLRGGPARFLAARTFAVITGRDAAGRLWTSPLSGAPGFLRAATPTRLALHTTPPAGDPLHGLPVGQPVGIVVLDFAARRRIRLNGTLAAATDTELLVDVEQAYGNCPQYVRPRRLAPADQAAAPRPARRTDSLDERDIGLIGRSDTLFIGSTHPTRGTDTSHRGGRPGFVRVQHATLWWPDYPGNNMFNTLGNLTVDAMAALLFADFTTGATVHLSGTTELDWATSGHWGGDDKTGRRVRFSPQAVVSGYLLPLRATATLA
jgi:hypothetical protein